jgi:hypothetical protein
MPSIPVRSDPKLDVEPLPPLGTTPLRAGLLKKPLTRIRVESKLVGAVLRTLGALSKALETSAF